MCLDGKKRKEEKGIVIRSSVLDNLMDLFGCINNTGLGITTGELITTRFVLPFQLFRDI